MNLTLDNRAGLVFLLIFLLGSFLRVYKLDESGTWQDEQWSISTSVGVPYIMYDKEEGFFNHWVKPWRDEFWKQDTIWKNKATFTSNDFWKFNTVGNVLGATVYASNNPIYNLALHLWIKIFGISDFSVRFFSVIFGCLTIIVVFLLARLLFNSINAALISSFLVSIHPVLIYESQSAKAYSLAIFLSLCSCYLFLRIIKGDSRKIITVACGLSLLLTIMTHMLSVSVLFGIGLIMLLFVRNRKVWLRVIAINLLVGSIYLVWMLNGGFESIKFLGAFTAFIKANVYNPEWTGDLFFIPATPANLLKGLEKFLLASFGNIGYNLAFRLRELWGIAFIPLLIILFALIKTKNKHDRLPFAYLITILVALVIFSAAISLKDNQVLQLGQLISVYGSAFACILLGASINVIVKFESKLKYAFYLLFAAHILGMSFSTYKIYSDPINHYYDFKKTPNDYIKLAEKIKANYSASDTIVYGGWKYAQITNLYLKEAPQVIQTVDTTMPNKGEVILSGSTSSRRTVLFDFKK